MSGFPWQGARFAEYHSTGPGAGGASAGRPQLTDERPRRRKPATGAATGPPDRTAPGGGAPRPAARR